MAPDFRLGPQPRRCRPPTARPGQRQAVRPSPAAYTSTRGSGPPRPQPDHGIAARIAADFERKLAPIGQPQSLHMRAHPGRLVEEDGQLSTKRAVVRINGVLARVARSSVTPTARPAVAPRDWPL
jgi:hypothetical protein